MNNSDLSSTIAQGLQQEAITLAELLAARTDEPGLRRAAELLAILAAVPTVDLRPHLEWALKRISTSLGEGEHYAAALHALEGAQQPAAVAPIAGHADIFQAGYWLSHQQLRPAGSFDINPLCDELKSGGWSEAPVFVGMPTLQVTLARGNEGDLAALVKRLARALRKAKPGNEMSDQAMDYLKRQGLLGSPLRDAPTLEAPAAPGAVLDLPSGAALLGTYWNVYDGATFAWGSCDSGYFMLDQFGWATWPTQESFSRALLLGAAPQASDAPSIDQLLDALSQHDDPCDDIADALDRVRVRVLRAEVDRLTRAENGRADAASPAVDASDTSLLDALTQHRIGLLPEYGGSWSAEIYLEGACAQHIGNGATPRETLRAALAAMVIEGGAA